jgi:hypothetical protein
MGRKKAEVNVEPEVQEDVSDTSGETTEVREEGIQFPIVPEGGSSDRPEVNENGEISIHTKGMVFEVENISGMFCEVAVDKLTVDTVCRYFPEGGISEEVLYRVVGAPINDGDEGDFIVQLKKMNDIEQPIDGPPASEEAATKNAAIIKVECPVSDSEKVMRGLINDWILAKENKKAVDSRLKAVIDEAEEALRSAYQGKTYTEVLCDISDDLEAGIRTYIDQKTGKVVKTEGLPRQLDMKDELDKATPKPEESKVEEESGNETTTEETEQYHDGDDAGPFDKEGEENADTEEGSVVSPPEE